MRTDDIEDNIDKVDEPTYRAILELIVDAIRDYPIKDLLDVEEYLKEVRELIDSSQISVKALDDYINQNSRYENEKSIWIEASLSSLAEAWQLIEMYHIQLSDILDRVERLH